MGCNGILLLELNHIPGDGRPPAASAGARRLMTPTEAWGSFAFHEGVAWLRGRGLAMGPTPSLMVAQLCQLAFVVGLSPLLRGLLQRFEARLQFRHGPPVLQPYRDLRKWWSKECVRSADSSWISAVTPVAYVLAPVLVTFLIPVLTTFPLPFAFMGDMLGGGFILAGGGTMLLFAALDSGGVFPALGVSRMRLIGVVAEPVAFLAVFTAAAVAGTTVPFVVNQTFASSAWLLTPTHILVVVAFFLLVLAETGSIPVDNPASKQEFSLIDPARTFEASGRDLALFEWGGWMKGVVLLVILGNVLVGPWGLSTSTGAAGLLAAAFLIFAKLLALGGIMALVGASFAKLRLLRIPEYLAAAIFLAFGAVVTAGFGHF
jgi:formate hydrogenlyase subunit 4